MSPPNSKPASSNALQQPWTAALAVGALVGLPAATTFRERFRTVTGVPPSAYRAAFRAR